MSEPQIKNIDQGIRRLGLFIGFFNAGIVFNSIVFRVVAGVLGKIPLETVAIVTSLEYTLNCLLEVPLGYVADRYGRVKSTIAGLGLISCGLGCIYAALLVEDELLKVTLIFADGVFLGIGKPLMSGSFQAFYEDAIRRFAGSDKTLLRHAEASFTKSSQFGKHLPLIATAVALPTLYLMHNTIGTEHAFAIGIPIYFYVIYRMVHDYRFLGEHFEKAKVSASRYVRQVFARERRAQYATFMRLCFQLINSIVSGYLIVTLLRLTKTPSLDEFFWPMLLSFTIATACSTSLRGYLLKPLYLRLQERGYILTFFSVHVLASFGMLVVVHNGGLLALTAGVFVYTVIFYIAQGALNLVTVDVLNSAVDSSYRATALSVFNMPGFLAVGLYGTYLSIYRQGTPPIYELFITISILATIGLVGSMLFSRGKNLAA